MRIYNADLARLSKVVALSTACSLHLLRQGCSPAGPRQLTPYRRWQAGPSSSSSACHSLPPSS